MFTLYPVLLAVLVYLHRWVYRLGSSWLPTFTQYKQLYITKNIWKSAILMVILMFTCPAFVRGFFLDEWSNETFWVWGTMCVMWT